MQIAVFNYQTGEVDILNNIPYEEELTKYFLDNPVQNALHMLGNNDDMSCFIEAYLEVICHYHMSEIDWMAIRGITFRDMGNI